MDAGDWVTAAIALAAMVVAWRAHRGQADIQEQLARIEAARRSDEVAAQARAQVTVRFEREDRGGGRYDRRLVVRNDGPALAHKVQVIRDEAAGVPGVMGLDVFPMDLQPGHEIPFMVMVGVRDGQRLPVEVRWIDGAGTHKKPWTLQVY